MKENYKQDKNYSKQSRNYDKQDRNFEKQNKNYDDQVEGRNAVLELLESGKDINKIFITKGERHGSINKIIAIAKEKRVIIVEKDKRQMEEIASTRKLSRSNCNSSTIRILRSRRHIR